jgi:DNA invertase Pin-like site-specific DNA recombinase
MDTLDHADYPGLVALYDETMRYTVRTPPTPAAAPVCAYSYLRFSDLRQADGDSVRRQTALRDAWLARQPHVRLDNTLFLDSGVSGFTKEHRTNPKHALARFLDLATGERRRVPVGSYLIVENLDRLTRENPVVSIPAVLSLIAAGIRVVQLTPVEIVYDSAMEQHQLMHMLWELSRGYGESKRKSGLCGAVWANKKAEARASRSPHKGHVPAWLELSEGRYRVKAGAAQTIRLIFKLAAQGLGLLLLTRRLNQDGVASFAPSARWTRSYVQKILAGREVLGFYQPHTGHKKRVPDGAPIPGYFPAIVTEVQWHAAQQAKQARQGRTGRPGARQAFLFAGLWRDALDDCPLHAVTRGDPRFRRRYVVSAAAAQGVPGACWRPFPLERLQEALLARLVELRASDLFADPQADQVAALQGQLAEVERRLSLALANFDAEPESATWQAQVTRYDRQKRALLTELAAATYAAGHPLSASWSEAVALMSRDNPDRLRAALLATLEQIPCVIARQGSYRLCACQVWFPGGARRDYLVILQPAVGAAQQPERYAVATFAQAGLPGRLDLRRQADARQLAAQLGRLDVAPLFAADPETTARPRKKKKS